MATMNPFDLLGDDDYEDPSQLIAAAAAAAAAAPKKPQPPADGQAKQQPGKSANKLPSKPAPPAQTGREAKSEFGRGAGRGGGGRGYGRGRGGSGGGYRRDSVNDENSFSNAGFPAGQGAPEDGESGRPFEWRGGIVGGIAGGYRGRGGRRSGFSNGDVGEGERSRRTFERRSGTGRGNELKREGSGRGNWGSQADEFPEATEQVNESEKQLGDEKPAGDGDAADADKEAITKEPEEKEPEDKEMTLEEYQKVLEEKRKVLQAKTEERKVDVKEFESMQQLSNKKGNDDVFIKLGSDKDKRKDAEKDEKAKKAVSINEFLKPAEGEKYYNPGGRGRGRGGRGSRGGYSGGSSMRNVSAPSIEDQGQFPTLGAK